MRTQGYLPLSETLSQVLILILKICTNTKKNYVVIVDPPREGLSAAVIKILLAQLPKRILYLSCKPLTQARDVQKLLEKYSVEDVRLFNFFPRTPHIESLVALGRKINAGRIEAVQL